MKVFEGKHGHKRGPLHKIEIKKAGNGFAVSAHHENDGMMMAPRDPDMVFTKHAPMMKHVKAMAQSMHPTVPSDEADELSPGAPVEQ